ncbi:MAG: ribonuclease III [Holosporales bacterium]|jgi:ribonuclease-3|nr:ribonuclease III [Holosporales bacterium]
MTKVRFERGKFAELEQKLGYRFKNKGLLSKALTHSSLKYGATDFERLEFLGDRVLGLVISEYIYLHFPTREGEMARMQSAFVCAQSCYEIGLNINLPDEIQTAGQHLKSNKTVLADAVEALLGAIFIEGGYDEVKKVVNNLWSPLIVNYDEDSMEPKTVLQEITQAETGLIPCYTLIETTGPSHEPEFLVQVQASNQTACAKGKSRKIAETNAAKILLQRRKIGSLE